MCGYEAFSKRLSAAGLVTASGELWQRAFSVRAIESLQALMNHSRLDTTRVYLRALNRFKAMEAVRDLSWATPSVFSSQDSEQAWMQEKAHTGFEPVPPP